jgi:hypothetical protein
MDERVWQLPGPRGFVRDIVAEHRRGRHVATVLPRALASDTVFTDSLSVALLEEFGGQSVNARRIYDAGPSASVLETFCQALIFDDQPATIPDLLIHPEVRDMVAVVVGQDLCAPARDELSRFLRRVELETHAAGSARRLSVVAIVTQGQLPVFPGGASSDMALTSIWWWARIARWDVAAHIAGLAGQSRLGGMLESALLAQVTETLGAARLTAVLRDRFNPPVKADTLVEIGILDKVVQMAIGSANPELRYASRRLREARNSLAHLRPMSLAEQESLVAACAFLR